MEAVAVLVPTGFFLMVGFIVFMIARTKARTAQVQAEVQSRLIDRFSSSKEFVDFLHSPEGKALLGGVDTLPKLRTTDNILRGIRTGIITTFLGLGFLALCLSEEVRNDGFLIAGCVLTAIGIGNFVSTFVSVRLSRQWGLMPGTSKAEEPVRDLTSSN
jgi:Na+/melibiose symporter-like transporter